MADATPPTTDVFAGIKAFLSKYKFGFLAVIAVSVIGGGAFLAFQHFEHVSQDRLAAAVKSAHDAGLAEAQRDTATAANSQMVNAIKEIQGWEADTNSKIAGLRVVAQTEHKTIDSYNADQIAVAHPEQVEAWANKTTGDLFAGIAAETVTQPGAK